MTRVSTKANIAATMVCVLALGAGAPAAQAAPSGWNDLAQSLGGPRDGGVIVEQLPTRLGGLGADTAFRDYIGRPVWQQIADNIVLTQTADVRHVEWYGFYGGSQQTHSPPTGDETMRVRFYAARPGDGLPGDVLYEQSFLNPSRIATGTNVVCDVLAPEYLFQADLLSPVTLAAATPYWLEIVQVGDLESHFRWEAGYGLQIGHATSQASMPEWQYVPTTSMAFQLSTIPEPSVPTLLALAAVLFTTTRHRKEDTHGNMNNLRRQW